MEGIVFRGRSGPLALGALVVSMTLAAGCSRTETPYRFIDRLTEDHVTASPLKPAGPPARRESPAPDWTEPLLRKIIVHDPPVGENPWSLEKKLVIGSEASPAILAVPPTELRFRLKVPPQSVLQFGCGLYAENWEGNADPTFFEVRVEGRRVAPAGLRVPLTLRFMHRHPRGVRREIDLAGFAGRTVTVTFRTEAAPSGQQEDARALAQKRGVAFWINPVLVRKNGPAEGTGSPPPIILISVDTVRADHLGLFGYGRPTSPETERLAGDSVAFPSCFSGAPYTLASHATMLTGLNPTRHQTLDLTDGLPADVPTVAGLLRGAGYETAAFTGGGQLKVQYGFAKGFDLYFERAGSNDIVDSAGNLHRIAAGWLKARRDAPFFLFLHTYQPHNPYQSPDFPERSLFLRKEYPWPSASLQSILGRGFPRLFRPLPPLEHENLTALYDLELRSVDRFLIGPLMEDLKRLGLYDKALIILTSDHGEEFYDHSAWEHGHSLYNELIRVPLLVKLPGSRNAGRRVDRAVGLVDLAPTILAEAGVEPPDSGFDGENLLPLLEEKKFPPSRTLMSFVPAEFHHDFPSRVAVIRHPFKLILNGEFLPDAQTYFTPPPPARDPVELFNLVTDPMERTNIVDREEAVARELLPLARSYLRDATDRGRRRKIVLDGKTEQELRSLGYLR